MKFDSAQWKPAKDRLREDTSGKCAYCEAPTATVAHGDVEHFRPKSIYWWLAFCLDNYLYSCQICNQSYKSDNFPVSGDRLAEPPMPADLPAGQALDALFDLLTHDAAQLDDQHFSEAWSSELADLPNPYLEDPEELFVYEIDPLNGEVWIRSAGGDRADRAMKAAENFLGLNRETLRRDRYAELKPLIAFREIIDFPGLPPAAVDIAQTHAREMRSAQHPYAGMCRYFADDWHI